MTKTRKKAAGAAPTTAAPPVTPPPGQPSAESAAAAARHQAMNDMGRRIWDMQSESLPEDERKRRVNVALREQGFGDLIEG